MVWPPDSPWSPWWRTNKKTALKIIKLAKITEKDFIVDLGCGDGTALITAAKNKKAHGAGVEIDPFRVLIAKIRVLLGGVSDLIVIKRGNLFDQDISGSSLVIVYLIPKTLKRLKKKFFAELKPGTKVISYMYQIDFLPEVVRDEDSHVYVYLIPKKRTNTEKN